eukprot:1147137-Pelagomonas_calceolata.AAC.2
MKVLLLPRGPQLHAGWTKVRDNCRGEETPLKKRKVYAGLRPRALREGSLTSRLAGASPNGCA